MGHVVRGLRAGPGSGSAREGAPHKEVPARIRDVALQHFCLKFSEVQQEVFAYGDRQEAVFRVSITQPGARCEDGDPPSLENVCITPDNPLVPVEEVVAAASDQTDTPDWEKVDGLAVRDPVLVQRLDKISEAEGWTDTGTKPADPVWVEYNAKRLGNPRPRGRSMSTMG